MPETIYDVAVIGSGPAGYTSIDRDRVMMESLFSIRRAGANVILTYFAKDAAKLLA